MFISIVALEEVVQLFPIICFVETLCLCTSKHPVKLIPVGFEKVNAKFLLELVKLSVVPIPVASSILSKKLPPLVSILNFLVVDISFSASVCSFNSLPR